MKSNRKGSESGFSYIDVMVAIVILLVGILALLAAISASVMRGRGQEQQITAKQIATSTMESIMSVKETSDASRLGWARVGNVGSNPHPETGVPQGIFVTGMQDVLTDAGPDQVLGTADDTGDVLIGFRRQITITDLCDPDRPSPNCPTPGGNPVKMRSVQIIVTYFIGTAQFREVLTTALTDYEITDDTDDEES